VTRERLAWLWIIWHPPQSATQALVDVLPCGGTGKLRPCGRAGKLFPCIGAGEAGGARETRPCGGAEEPRPTAVAGDRRLTAGTVLEPFPFNGLMARGGGAMHAGSLVNVVAEKQPSLSSTRRGNCQLRLGDS